ARGPRDGGLGAGSGLPPPADRACGGRGPGDPPPPSPAAAAVLGLDEAEATRRVVEAMLAEARRLSATDPESPALSELLTLILERPSPCPEASFWLGLYHLRRGDTAAGVAALEAAHEATQGR